jgi:hypothetical protein
MKGLLNYQTTPIFIFSQVTSTISDATARVIEGGTGKNFAAIEVSAGLSISRFNF